MRLLLDTHTFIWLAADSPSLSDEARSTFLDRSNEAFLSLASVWEMAIKTSLGKLELDLPLGEFVAGGLNQHGVALLPIELPQVLQVRKLPLHHRDPFDRLLVAQALVEDLVVLGRDEAFDAYPVQRIW